MTTTPPLRSADFINSLGVQIHLRYSDGNYRFIQNVIADMHYLGISNARDMAPSTSFRAVTIANYNTAAASGIKFDFLIETDLPGSLAATDAFIKAYSKSVIAIEGPNEINNMPITYNGKTGTDGAIAFQNAIYSSVKSDPLLARLPVYDLTNSKPLATTSDVRNVHIYPPKGTEPSARIASAVATLKAVSPDKPVVITEAGYSSAATATDGVDQVVQAKLTLNFLMDAAQTGVSNVYLYELMDAYADPTGATLDKHYGLFDYSNAPKLAAVAIHNLTSLLSDTGTAASNFTATTLQFTATGLPTTAHSLEMEKSSGAYELVFWDEPTIWNATTHTEVAAKSNTVSVDLGKTYAEVKVFDPLGGTGPIADLHNVRTVSLNLLDHPVILEIEPQIPLAASAGSLPSFVSHSSPLTSLVMKR